jgi:hypothetical protein
MISRHQESPVRLPISVALAMAVACWGLAVPAALAQTGEKTAPTSWAALDCKRCHTCENPTLPHPCLPACTRVEAAALKLAQKLGPEVVILDELEGVYLPVPFDHKGHAHMAEMTRGCSTCHHYTPEGGEHPACKACHEKEAAGTDIRKPGLKGAYHRQCLNCHKDWIDETDCAICHRRKSGVPEGNGRVMSPTSDDILGRMHPPITKPSTEIYRAESTKGSTSVVIFRHWEHVQGFDLACVDCHHEDNCTRCHKKEGAEERPRTVKEHHRPCQFCHKADMDKTATEITGKCKRCHWREGEPMPKPFDHADTGWPLSKYHVGNRCRDCHWTVPFKKLDKECTACHSDWSPETFDHRVTGQVLDENHAEIDCGDCHTDRKFGVPPTCVECHDEDEGIAFPAKRPGPSPFGSS